MSYIQSNPLEVLSEDVKRLRKKFPDRVPCIIEKDLKSKNNLPELPNKKHLCRSESTVASLLMTLRKWLHVSNDKGVFLYVNNVLPVLTDNIGEVYKEHMHESGLLLFTYTCESTFGI